MKKHIHADLMLQYAQDAMETATPWKRWQSKNHYGEWVDMHAPLTFYANGEYRRKPRTININGFEVPEPVREPLEDGDIYYLISFADDIYEMEWRGHESGKRWLNLGIIHLTREAAELHAKALLSFTEKKA